jgi:hypothetical protein
MFGDKFDENLLMKILLNLNVEIHLQWPLSQIIHSDSFQSLNKSFRYLLQLSSLKWIAECWWKAVISSGYLSFIQYKPNYFKNIKSIKYSMENKTINTAGSLSIKQSKNVCRLGVTNLLHYSSGLFNYIMTQIHGKIFSSFKYRFDQTRQSVIGIRHLFDDMISEVELLLNSLEDYLSKIVKTGFAASSSLREAVFLEMKINNVSGEFELSSKLNKALEKSYKEAENAFYLVDQVANDLKSDLHSVLKLKKQYNNNSNRMLKGSKISPFNAEELLMYI